MNKYSSITRRKGPFPLIARAYSVLDPGEKEAFIKFTGSSKASIQGYNRGRSRMPVDYVIKAREFFKNLGYDYSVEELNSSCTAIEFKSIQAQRFKRDLFNEQFIESIFKMTA